MLSIGLDIGTAFVKCVSDNSRIIFPSLYAYRTRERWESGNKTTIGVGEEALKISAYPNAVVIRPVIEGRPVHQEAFEALVKEAVSRICRAKIGAIVEKYYAENAKIAIGLPYNAASEKESLRKIIIKTLKPDRCIVVPQVVGTLEYVKRRSGIVMSIGQGTTEIVAFEDMKPVSGISLMQACDFITSQFGEFSYLDTSFMNQHAKEIEKRSELLAEILSNRFASFISSLNPMHECSKRLILSGGGLLMPRLKAALLERIGMDVQVTEDPVMSNAIGLHMLASR